MFTASTVSPTIESQVIEGLDNLTTPQPQIDTPPAGVAQALQTPSKCPDCICTSNDAELKSATAELRYLKWMVRLLGSLMRRENAMNRVMSEHCKGTFAMVPIVQKADQETQYVQSLIQKEPDMLSYFQNHFTHYSGIPSKPYQEIL